MPFEENQTAIDNLFDEADGRAIRIVTERVADLGRSLMPVWQGGPHNPRPGRARANPDAGSWPPGNMKRSVSTSYRRSAFGKPQGVISAAWQYVFHAKKRHGFRPALDEALARQYGREVP